MADGQKGMFSIIGASLHKMNVFLFEKNKKAMYVAAFIMIPGLTAFVFNLEADKNMLGADDIRDIIAGLGGGNDETGGTDPSQKTSRHILAAFHFEKITYD
ncbi:MAG: hypothetical protein ACMUHY_03640, partial [Thermoplasmatota archaeon]